MKKIKSYSEAELIKIFKLNRQVGQEHSSVLQEWLDVPEPKLNTSEKVLFDYIYQRAVQHIAGWQEEDLKMKLIAFVLHLGHLEESEHFKTYFEKTISATVEDTFLKTKTDFMVAEGILDLPDTPYFHFQEYKPNKNPSGDSMAQLLEAFLIAQDKNETQNPLYGCEIIGERWKFIVMEGKDYCISKTYDCTVEQELLQIIAILRKFREILETRLLKP